MLKLLAGLIAVITGVALMLATVLKLMTQVRNRQYCGSVREVW